MTHPFSYTVRRLGVYSRNGVSLRDTLHGNFLRSLTCLPLCVVEILAIISPLSRTEPKSGMTQVTEILADDFSEKAKWHSPWDQQCELWRGGASLAFSHLIFPVT